MLLGLKLVILGFTGWGVRVGPGAGKALSMVLHGLPGLLLLRMVLGLGLVGGRGVRSDGTPSPILNLPGLGLGL